MIMTSKKVKYFLEEKLCGSIIISLSPLKYNKKNILFSDLLIIKLFKKPIHTKIQININKDYKVLSWIANLPIGKKEYHISGLEKQYNKSTHKKVNSYITNVCQNMVNDFFKELWI